MKHLFQKLTFIALCWLCLAGPSALAQTADEYVRPYTENYQYGANLGYYGTTWTDEALAGLLQATGGHSVRPTLPEWFVEAFGYKIRVNEFDNYVNKLGMKELTCFIEGPSDSHRDWNTYSDKAVSSKLFANLYAPIWNSDGTVNPTNYYAIYVYKLLLNYGDKVRFWEVLNEPDFANGASAAAWLTRAPTPDEQLNTRAPFYHYIRMLRITYEVVKKYHPEAYVSTSVGYPEYVDALMRYTDNPNEGAVTPEYSRKGGAYFDVLSYHAYPNYALHKWDNDLGGFRYTRTSDYSANRVIQYKDEMVAVLDKYGYNGTTHPKKLLTLSESNVSRRTSGDRTSSDERQRNFGIKALVLTQKHDIKQFYLYQIGETVNAPAPGTSVSGGEEIGLMGLYENLKRDGPGSTKILQLGRAFSTTSKLLYGYYYDAARTTALALPSNIDGAAFRKDGQYIYVLWAKALIDNVEEANATYSFPAATNVGTVERYEWDYSLNGTKTSQPGQGIELTTTPSFFIGTAAPPQVACSATGTLLREQWDNVSGTTIASIPLSLPATSSAAITQFEASSQTAYNYAARVRGYICAPATGAYTFSIVGDDAAELYLSTDADPTKKVRIASCAGWTANNRDFTRMASQQSAPIQLVTGQRYYIEALHKQGWGPGYLAVAWQLPNGTRQEPIPGSQLSPFVVAPTTPPTTVACEGTGSLLREHWRNVSGTAIGTIPTSTTPSSSAAITQFEAPALNEANYAARVRGYLCPPRSGPHTFWIVGDDEAELYLSTDADPAKKVRIATCNTWTASNRDFARYPSQQSATIQLQAGTRYYIEALHKQGWGPGYLAVAWRQPDGTRQEPIPGDVLIPFVPTQPILTEQIASSKGLGSQATELLAYPNPFTHQATVQFNLASTGKASLAIYDLQGKLVRQLYTGQSEAGTTQRFTLEAQGLSHGLYVLRLVTDNNVLTQKLVFGR
ncbi:PA14 domain-containing protein [Hymenobacter arizonensis]|uniref:Por secretion system C-terminal sorting domain-containing protein n=1 Tax=Hymenobacter arizonensis TaxID=1227077 RepID=A0A1I5VF15_HYMAR|nr:PA14 domain-containing protein [Hymenobacter arizonensis]SFQ05937.1 Por secretion system C-terminal sorting domain-containing protein [Hymenobacter arizonensis]